MSEGEVTGRVWWLVGCRDGLAVSAGDVEEERVGPFVSYEEARRAWSDRAWSSVDDAEMRWSIVEGDADG